MADMKTLKGRGNVLVTYSLGSCIAVAASDPAMGVGGLLHFMLPESRLAQGKAGVRPFMFADTGIAALLDRLEREGASLEHLIVKIAGGAQMLDASTYFNIGQGNYLAARHLLSREGLAIKAEDVGGTAVRTIEFEVATGRVRVRLSGNRVKPL
jgi:chemotaxis protein CheD